MAARGRGDQPLPELPPNAAGNRAKTVKEHKRINALNLEPGLSKSNDSLSSVLSGVKEANRGNLKDPESIKKEFESSLAKIKDQQTLKEQKKGKTPTPGEKPQGSTPADRPMTSSQQLGTMAPSKAVAAPPGATSLFPTPKNSNYLKLGLEELLEPFFKVCASADVQREDTRWPNTARTPYIETLGKPDPSNTAAQQMMNVGVQQNVQGMQAMPGMPGMQGVQGVPNMQGMQGMHNMQGMPNNAALNPQAGQWQQQPQGPMAPNQPQSGGPQMMQGGYTPQQMQQMYPMQQGGYPQQMQQSASLQRWR